MIKAVLFDFDGVLTIDKTGSQPITAYLAQASGVPLEIVRPCYYTYNDDLLNGKVTHYEIWNNFCKDIGKEIDFNILEDAFRNTRLDQDMIEYVKELKQSYLTGMVTDNKADRIHMVLKENDLEKYFDVVSISADYHSGKKNTAIFEGTLKKLKLQPSECIFIDNTAKNLIVPEQMGMKTILFDDEHREIAAFRKQLETYLND